MWCLYQPDIGSWFKNKEINNLFEVVATDDEGNVEVQYFAGEIEEFDIETWNALNLSPIPPPEDCSGPFELSIEDLGYSDNSYQPEKLLNPLTMIEPEENY